MKVLMTPDIRILAKLAEEAGVDLRVIVLSRGYGDIFRSTRIHRHFGSNDVVQTKDLTVNAAMLASQVQLIDPAFVMCVRYNDLGDLGWWQKPSNGAVGGKGLTHAHWLLNPTNNAGWINRAVPSKLSLFILLLLRRRGGRRLAYRACNSWVQLYPLLTGLQGVPRTRDALSQRAFHA